MERLRRFADIGYTWAIWAIYLTLYTTVVLLLYPSIAEMTHITHIDCDILYIFQAIK
jgi:hypothetical protein